jgi:histidinol-phosphatase (PHP family)
MSLPADGHVHSEWSWDAPHGSMERSCARAAALGLPAIAFTEHLDHTVWTVELDELSDLDPGHPVVTSSDPEGRVSPAPFDVTGYLGSIERCRDLFPELRILSGLELGEPHWHEQAVNRVLDAGTFDRIIGSLHCLPDGDQFREPPGLFAVRDPGEVLRSYLAEIARLVAQSDAFSVLGHIDYPIRSWPNDKEPFVLATFEDEFRHTLRVVAQSGRALEINTVIPLHAVVLQWWHEEGGDAVTFGSDAHDPSKVAQDFAGAAAMAEAHGFRPGSSPFDLWARTR